jgi:hypothetical protein
MLPMAFAEAAQPQTTGIGMQLTLLRARWQHNTQHGVLTLVLVCVSAAARVCFGESCINQEAAKLAKVVVGEQGWQNTARLAQ